MGAFGLCVLVEVRALGCGVEVGVALGWLRSSESELELGLVWG